MAIKRAGYFGGTFDPPHLGHEILAQEALYQLELDEFNWLITPVPPHKGNQIITPVEQRLEMLKRLTQGRPEYRISRVDLDRASPHYAADSVELIKKVRPGLELVYILGQDSLSDLPDWYQPERFLSGVDSIAVAPRPGRYIALDELEKALPGLSAKCVFLEDVMVEISSSLVRSRIRHKAPYRHFLNPGVADYIEHNGLYSE